MNKVVSVVLSIALLFSTLCFPVCATAQETIAEADTNNTDCAVVLNGTEDYAVWKADKAGEKNISLKLKSGSVVFAVPVISGNEGESIKITADADGWYSVGTYSFNEGDYVKFTTDSNAVISGFSDYKDESFFDKVNCVETGKWNKTGSSWLDYDGTKAWYGGSAYWEFSGKEGKQELWYYVPSKAVNSKLWNTLVTVVKVAEDNTEVTVDEIHMSKGPSNSGWVHIGTFEAVKDSAYRIKISKGPGDISGVSDDSRLCAVKLVHTDELLFSDLKMTVPAEKGMCNVSLYVTKGMKAEVSVTALSETLNFDIDAVADGKYELGNYDFSAGGKISFTDISNFRIKNLEVNSANFAYLDTTTAELTDLSRSGVKGFNSAPGYYGNGSAKWTVPSSVSGLSELYYYMPDTNKNGTTSCSAIITYTADDGSTVEKVINGSDIKAGWHKLGVVNLSGSGEEILEVKRYTAESYSTVVRVYGFKIVEIPDSYRVYAFKPESFGATGDWTVKSGGKYGKYIMESMGSAPAVSKVKLKNGRYYVYVLDCDFKDYITGFRNFSLKLNGTTYKKENGQNFGTHQLPGTNTGTAENNTPVWEWEKIGYPCDYIDVTDGEIKLELKAFSTYARAEMVVVTDNPFITLENINDYVFASETVITPATYDEQIPYPEDYKGDLTNVNSTVVLSNDNTTVTFKQGTLSNGNTAVQRQTVVKDTVTNTFGSGLGFLSIRADEAIKGQTQGYYAKFNVGYRTENGYEKIDSQNVYVCGKPEWLIPKTLEKLSENSVKLTAENDNVLLTSVWTLEENDLEPKVDVTAEIKTDGVYTFGFFNDVNEIPEKEVGYILNPYRWQEKRLSPKGYLLRESSSTTAHTQMTYKMNEDGNEITLGVAVDESSIAKNRWTHDIAGYTRTDYYGNEFTIDYTDEQSNFAMGSVGHNGGVLPVVFAPLLTTDDSVLSSGDTYTFSYRPLATVSDEGENRGWYDCYRHVAKDLRGVYDYRDNYYDSMTNTVFNLTELAMDDFYGGWDENMVGHYNIEDTYWVTNANGLAYLQNYLLTEDEDMLMRRTLPSMATLLTRGSALLNSEWSYNSRTEGPINKELVTSPISTFGNTTYEGAYLMTRGMMPVFREISKSSYMNTGVEKAGISVKNASDALWYDYSRGDSNLTNAKEQADKYLERRAFYSADNYVSEGTFVNNSFTPDIQSQLDMYEATGNKKYLEGAIEAARRFLPLLRTDGVPQDKNETTVLDAEQLANEAKVQCNGTWWYNGEGYRRGADMYVTTEETENGSVAITRKVKGPLADALVPAETEYPAWVTGRTGLGVEQFATCGGNNRNVYMSTWASDLLRAGYLADDELIMDMARCAVVGRFENYPGYYIGAFNPLVGEYEYPYEGFDTTNLYFHHIPVLLVSLQDFLFSNAYVKSDGKVDFPYTRAQGYAWFNNRMYGHEAGKIYEENDMWPWLEKGTITVSSKQIDWIAGRKDNRAAFVLTNASDSAETVTVAINSELNVVNGTNTVIYDKAGNKTYQAVNENQLTLTVPAKGILTFAVSGRGIKAPAYSKIEFDKTAGTDLTGTAQGYMYKGNTYKQGNGTYSCDTGYDVKAYALAISPESYMGYVFVGGRSAHEKGGDGDNGIIKTTLKWHYENESEVHTEVDDYFPYEFFIPVSDRSKNILFNVETEYKDGVKTLAQEGKIKPADITLDEGVTKENFEPVSMSIINALGAVSSPLTNKTEGKSKYCIASADAAEIPFDISAKNALEGCYLSGYLKVLDNSSTDVVEKGYILYDNVPIVESVINTSKNGRLDFSAANITISSDVSNAKEYVDGVYVGELQGTVTAKKNYEWDNLYITNAGEKKGLQIIRDGNSCTISTDGAECLFVVIAEFEGDRMVSVSTEQIIVSVNNSKTYTVEDGQKLFVWKCDVNKGTTMQPVAQTVNK